MHSFNGDNSRILLLLAFVAGVIGSASLYPGDTYACDDAHPDREFFVGRWTWIQSVSPLDGDSYTPATTGSTHVYTFHDNGSYEIVSTSPSGEVGSWGTWCLRECDGQGSPFAWCAGQTILFLDAAAEFPSEMDFQLGYGLCEESCGYSPVEVEHGRALAIAHTGVTDAEVRIFEWDPGVPSTMTSWGSMKARY